MAGNNRPAKTVRNEIAVLHAGAPDHPRGLVCQSPHHKAVLGFGHDQRQGGGSYFHPSAVWGRQINRALSKFIRIITQNAQTHRLL